MYELKQNESGTWICHDTRANKEFPRPASNAEIFLWEENERICRIQRQGRAVDKDALAFCYQYVGAYGREIEVLDNLSALTQGNDPPHPWPVIPPTDKPVVRTVAPVIGEIVHYTHGGNPFAAIVVNVHQDGTVNLTWFGIFGGKIYGSDCVPFKANGAEGTWRWPPERTI